VCVPEDDEPQTTINVAIPAVTTGLVANVQVFQLAFAAGVTAVIPPTRPSVPFT